MEQHSYEAVVVGAGIAGVAAAYALVQAGLRSIAIVESDAPLALTSDKSTECYRNFWPGLDDAMLGLVSDSIDRLMEHAKQSGDRFQMRQRGYLFATARADELAALEEQAAEVERFGGGAVRHHTGGGAAAYPVSPMSGIEPGLDGADLITDQGLLRAHFPYLSRDAVGALHVRKCGALSAQQLGMYLLEEARDGGADLIRGAFVGIETARGQLSSVTVGTPDGELSLETQVLVLATGPHLKATAALAGTDLPVEVEKHIKISLSDTLGVVPRDAPLLVWNDPIDLNWSAQEREMLSETAVTRRLLETFPAGVHGRPIGVGDQLLMYWTYDCERSLVPTFPLDWDPFLPEVTLRGMAVMVPELGVYLDPMPKPYVDGGYYTKTADNRPLIGPLRVPGSYVCGSFSGFGIMASCAAGELLAGHVTGKALPKYADAFRVERFDDPSYCQRIEGLAASGQL